MDFKRKGCDLGETLNQIMRVAPGRSTITKVSSNKTVEWHLVASPAAGKTAKDDEDPDQNLGNNVFHLIP